MRAIMICLLYLTCAASTSAAIECVRPAPATADTVVASRLRTFGRSDSTELASVLGLARPWSLELIESWHCGTTIRGAIRDNRGSQLRFEWDGCLYLGGYHSDPGARAIEPGAREELAVISLLRLYANSQIPIPSQFKWTSTWFDCRVPTEERAARLPNLDSAQQLGLQALRLAYVLEGRWTGNCAPGTE
jgi:hypothetical protein